MKKRRALLLTLLALLLVIGIPMSFLVREYRQEKLNQELIAAINSDDVPAALAALQNHADPNSRDHSDDPPRSSGERLKRLFDKVLQPNSKTTPDTNPTPLHLVFLQIHIPSGKYPANIPTPYVRQPEEHASLVQALLDAGANPNLTNRTGFTPLHLAVSQGYLESTRLMIQHGANVNAQSMMGFTPLEVAVMSNHASTVRILIDSGADVNIKDKPGLMSADEIKHYTLPEIIEMLRKAGDKTGKEL